MGLGGVLRKHYPRWVLYTAISLLVIANTINAGTDIGAIAASINLLVPVPALVLVVPIAMGIVALQILGSYALISRIFKWLTLTLFGYIVAAFLARPHWGEVLKATVIPTIRFDHVYLMTLVAILGTTISPYLFFWQASQEVEEELRMGRSTLAEREGATDREIKIAEIDVDIGMFFASLVFYFVILASAATLHAAGKTDIQTATQAAEALRPLSGNGATILFALGLIGCGFLAVPVLTGSSAYAIGEAFRWPTGLDRNPNKARAFYATIIIATLSGIAITFSPLDPIKALFWSAVINGLVAVPVMAMMMFISSNKNIMGKFAVKGALRSIGWLATGVMAAAAIVMFVTAVL
jgi:Mn2+/Fe2+ NRAMP family transporter